MINFSFFLDEKIRFFKNIYRIIYYLLWRVYHFNKRQYRRIIRFIGLTSDSNELEENWKISTDDDLADENYSPSIIDSDSSSDEGEEDENSDASEIEDEDGEEVYDPTELYRDLSSPVSRRHQQINTNSSPVASASNTMTAYSNYDDDPEEEEDTSTVTSAEQLMPIFLAHQLSNSNSPLTRRRYNSFNPNSTSYNYDSSSSSTALTSAIQSRRQELSLLSSNSTSQDQERNEEEEELEEARQAERERSRTCIVCSVEERTIILWPCRCLCICEDCRESIAQRSNQSSSLCPTCRIPIKGFSRIFVP